MRRSLFVLCAFVNLFVPIAPTAAAPPPGQSALLNGMHDVQSFQWMKGATSGCDKGWITDLQYIGSSGTAGANCHKDITNAGISIIQRLDVSGSESYPHDAAKAAGYAGSFASFASQCSNIHVWIVGNEPNFTVHKSDPDCSSAAYAKAYVEVHKKIHALPGHQNDLVLVASNSPYSPGCLESLRQILKNIQAAGVQPDGVAIHPYTRAANGGVLNASYVTNNRRQNDNTINECAGPATWADTWYGEFRIYIDYIKVIEQFGLTGKPVFITESGNACEPKQGNQCYPNADVGYFQALYKEVNRWNNLSTTKTKIRAITPYRWTLNDDGTGRDFAIGNRPKLLDDLKKAFAQKYSWTTPCGGSSGCTKDADCPAGQICDTANGQCKTKPAGSCTTPSNCPGQVCSPTTCSTDPGACVGVGSGQFVITPQDPKPGDTVKISFIHPTGHTFIGLRYCGPTQGKGSGLKIDKAPNGQHRWTYEVTVQEGLYRIDFTADKEATIVGSTNLLVAPACSPQAETCNQKDDDCDGQIDEDGVCDACQDGQTQPCYSGPTGTANVGTCRSGTQTCQNGQWSTCTGEVKPSGETCNNNLDDDCNGVIDNGCPGQENTTPTEHNNPDSGNPSPDQNNTPDTNPRESGILRLDSPRDDTLKPRGSGCGCHTTLPPPLPLALLALLALCLFRGRRVRGAIRR